MEMVLTLTVVLVCFVVMVGEWLRTDFALVGALAILTAVGVIDVPTALQGFASPTVLALGALFVIAHALNKTGALALAGRHLLGKTHRVRRLLVRLGVSTSFVSAFLNNTPVVAMGIPAIERWSQEHRVDASRLLMPFSFASILGGMCTLIGTSTNLVADGLMRRHGLGGLGFFELAWVGIPCVIAGLLYMVLIAPRHHGAHRDVLSQGPEWPLPPAEVPDEPGGWRMWLAIAVLVAVVLLAATGAAPIAWAGLGGALVLMVGGVVSPREARNAVGWEVLIVIAAALGLGRAMEASGAAALIGRGIIVASQPFGPVGVLAGVIIATSLLTQLITNNGAIALVFPIALSVAATQGIDPRPLVIGATLGASLSFATPLSYQTNLMVYNAGDYSFADFVRVGLPLQLVLTAVMIAVIPLVWPV